MQKTSTKEELHLLNQERFKKSAQEKEEAKKAKAAWKKENRKIHESKT